MVENITISHVRKGDNKIQENKIHQEGVSVRATHFADVISMGQWGKLMGLLHDKGKEKKTFQKYIIKESGLDPSIHVDGDHSHAYVGALIARKLFPYQSDIIVNQLAGHHRGLYDYDELHEVLNQKIPDEITIEPIDINLSLPNIKYTKKDLHHLIRFLYSCLVDADFLDTEEFMLPEQAKLREHHYNLASLLDKLNEHLRHLSGTAPATEVNRIRAEIQDYCRQSSHSAKGFYSMTVPTGGGKTLSSILWALQHAIHHKQKRIIIAIPYTSIIAQTAQVLRHIFGDDNVLEHHSNTDYSDIDDIPTRTKKLATENWDYPIVVTTNVQLFESLFSNRPSDCRKLHNIAQSIIILDEVQTLPMEFLQPIIDTLDTLQRCFGCSILFTTASQPILTGRIEGCNPTAAFNALNTVHEIIPANANLHQRLRRTEIVFDTMRSSYDDIAQRLSEHQQVLCIVNTRRDAREIFSRLPDEGVRLHLSRMMCPDHVKSTIDEIKKLLKKDTRCPIRVVATQLIEAGVDIDFPVVYRQEAGLDSVLQAAGRCNREGKLPKSTTHVFALRQPLPPGHISHANNARLNIGSEHDWLAPETMTSYFKQLHARTESFDKTRVKDSLYSKDMLFETAAKNFRLIDEKTISVIVNWKNSMNLVAELKTKGVTYRLMKQLSQYSVDVRRYDIRKLQEAGAIEEVVDDIYMISNHSYYNKNTGLTTDNQWLEETYIV